MEHDLKTWPSQFDAMRAGAKRYEVRKFDRDFNVGDVLHLREWVPAHEGECRWRTDLDEQQSREEHGRDLQCSLCGRWKRDPETDELTLPLGKYTGRSVRVTVTFITHPGTFGLPKDVGVLGIDVPSHPIRPWM